MGWFFTGVWCTALLLLFHICIRIADEGLLWMCMTVIVFTALIIGMEIGDNKK